MKYKYYSIKLIWDPTKKNSPMEWFTAVVVNDIGFDYLEADGSLQHSFVPINNLLEVICHE